MLANYSFNLENLELESVNICLYFCHFLFLPMGFIQQAEAHKSCIWQSQRLGVAMSKKDEISIDLLTLSRSNQS